MIHVLINVGLKLQWFSVFPALCQTFMLWQSFRLCVNLLCYILIFCAVSLFYAVCLVFELCVYLLCCVSIFYAVYAVYAVGQQRWSGALWGSSTVGWAWVCWCWQWVWHSSPSWTTSSRGKWKRYTIVSFIIIYFISCYQKYEGVFGHCMSIILTFINF